MSKLSILELSIPVLSEMETRVIIGRDNYGDDWDNPLDGGILPGPIIMGDAPSNNHDYNDWINDAFDHLEDTFGHQDNDNYNDHHGGGSGDSDYTTNDENDPVKELIQHLNKGEKELIKKWI